MTAPPDIQILLATYNRASDLRRTLEAFTQLNVAGITLQIVIVDNNSKDDTRSVVEAFTARLPIRYLHEPRPGKNCALNRALAEIPPGKLVVFTDDDVDPEPDWLNQVIAAADRWPDYHVFGGRIELRWPNDSIPLWARDPYIQEFVFSHHALEQPEGPYPPRLFPFGPNFWVRGDLFAGGRRFNEAVGPRPSNRIMGSETSILKEFADEGHTPIYVPAALVHHRIQPEHVSLDEVRRRAYRLGRQGPHVEGLCRRPLLERSPLVWRSLRIASLARGLLSYGISRLDPRAEPRLSRAIVALQIIGYNLESLRLARAARSE